jgi:hypothetical protein
VRKGQMHPPGIRATYVGIHTSKSLQQTRKMHRYKSQFQP